MTENSNPTVELIDALIEDELEQEIMHLIIAEKNPEEIIEILVEQLSKEGRNPD
jgi:hypothetical protein